MIEQHSLITFTLASLLLGLAPGPDNLFVLTQSALHGRSAGLVITLGLCSGLVCHSVAVAFGVAVIFQTSALAFSVLKFTGAVYLAYLAWGAFRAPVGTEIHFSSGAQKLPRLYRRGIIMNITNPKVSIFFMAFLPQFTNPASGPLPVQMLLLGGIFILTTIVVFGAIALLAGTCGQWLHRSARVQKVLNLLAGSVFLGIAVKLALTER